jgi:peroxiredoxin family protein
MLANIVGTIISVALVMGLGFAVFITLAALWSVRKGRR